MIVETKSHVTIVGSESRWESNLLYHTLIFIKISSLPVLKTTLLEMITNNTLNKFQLKKVVSWVYILCKESVRKAVLHHDIFITSCFPKHAFQIRV